MSAPLRRTAPLLRRFVRGGNALARKGNPSLHPKHGPRFHYKGNRVPPMGWHTRNSAYIVDYENRVPQYVAPDLADCQLKAYVSAKTPLTKVPSPV